MRTKAILVCTFLLISALSVGAATYQTIYSFTRYNDGENPYAGVIFDPAGNLYGVTPWGETNEGVIFQLAPSQGGWTFHSLHRFDLQDPDGAGLKGGLAMDEAGNLYGTASNNHGPEGGCGTVFKLSPSGSSWTFSVLHYFAGADGCDPESALTYSKGWLLGTTRGGGSTGQGTVFSMDTDGDSFQFDSFSKKKGREPLSAVNLWGYGTTYSGGGRGQGNVYKLDPTKGFVIKHSFGEPDSVGYSPMGDLFTTYVGNVRTMYGTTSAGGRSGNGAVYRLTEKEPNSDTWRIGVVHAFTGGVDGALPMAGVTVDQYGYLYGTTYKGGDWDCGTVFKINWIKNKKWSYTVLYSFNPNESEGCHPTGGLALDKAGNLYGTTQSGGDYFAGAVYEITP